MAQRILLFGGNSGIGAALKKLLEAEDVQVLTMSRSQQGAVDVTAEGPEFPAVEGSLDGLVYCPGNINLKPFASLSVEDFRRDFELNVLGAVKVLQFYRENLDSAEQASVVLFSTVAVQTGMAFHASTAASKGAVEGLARSLAAEWAPRIRVNVVAPSLTDTPLAQRLLRSEKQREAAAARHPAGRIGQATDPASAARFLLSEDSAWITGQVLAVDGGISSLRMM